jgi:hypothetical protein
MFPIHKKGIDQSHTWESLFPILSRTLCRERVLIGEKVKIWVFKGEHVRASQDIEERTEPGSLGRGVARFELGQGPCSLLVPTLVKEILMFIQRWTDRGKGQCNPLQAD